MIIFLFVNFSLSTRPLKAKAGLLQFYRSHQRGLTFDLISGLQYRNYFPEFKLALIFRRSSNVPCIIIIYSKDSELASKMMFLKNSCKMPKKINEKLNKFSHYTDVLFPELFSLHAQSLDNGDTVERPVNELLTHTTEKELTYHYFHSECESSAAIDSHSILSSVKKLYLNQDVVKLSDLSFSRESVFKVPYLPIYGYFSEIIDFVLICEHDQELENMKNPRKSSETENRQNVSGKGATQTDKVKTLQKPNTYELYVIHNCNVSQSGTEQYEKIEWQHFVEKYTFTENDPTNKKSKAMIYYDLAYCYKVKKSFANSQIKLTDVFLKEHCKASQDSLENLDKLQGHLLQQSSQVEASLKIQNDPAFSEELKRQNKVPVQYFKSYMALKREVYDFYIDLHKLKGEEEINKYFLDNLICRYLIAKQYHFEEAKSSTKEYLTWQVEIKQKYPSLECFREYQETEAYRFIGTDHMGRPIVLSKASLVDVNKIDVEKYCDYYIYFLEIYIKSKMRGYVDQMIVIGDLANLGTSNFKLAITKRNLSDSLKYGPERQYALTTVNVSSFAYTAWSFIKPMMPKKTLSKIGIVGTDKKDIVNALSTKMDISVIPQYLGGEGKHVQTGLQEFDNGNQESQEAKQTPVIRKAQSAQPRLADEELEEPFENISLVSPQSVKEQINPNKNVLFDIFEGVTKGLGIKL